MRDAQTIELLERKRKEWQDRLDTREKSQVRSSRIHAELFAIAGVLVFLAGVFLIYRPLALIAAGAVLFAYAWGCYADQVNRR